MMNDQPFAYPMTPAWRAGALTPWGGDALARLFGKQIPDPHSGESLEASTLPGLCSTCPDGTPLDQLAGRPLPLMVKLLDAAQMLSVQVHPDDAYALAHEGKSGKEEAWLVLSAPPHAKLVYGLRPGTRLDALTPQTLEASLRWVEVRPGDCCYIPPGMIHAAGNGIVVYEIQQTSDVTYRFWDWGRLGADGKPRPLHWEDACRVSDPSLQLLPSRGTARALPGGEIVTYPTGSRFCLQLYLPADGAALPLREHPGFLFLTALDGATLACDGDTLFLPRGVTAYVPENHKPLTVSGGRLILSCEA